MFYDFDFFSGVKRKKKIVPGKSLFSSEMQIIASTKQNNQFLCEKDEN